MQVLKRIFPIFAVVALIGCMVVPASAASSTTVINYADYLNSSYTDYLGQRWDNFQLPRSLCAYQTIDKFGVSYVKPYDTDLGVSIGHSGTVVCDGEGNQMAVGAYWPGGLINNVYINASNLPDGTLVNLDVQFTLVDAVKEAYVSIRGCFGVNYFDKNFSFIGYQVSKETTWDLDCGDQLNGTLTCGLSLVKPANAAYLTFYSPFNMRVDRAQASEVTVEWQIGNPYFEVHNAYVSPDVDSSGSGSSGSGSSGSGSSGSGSVNDLQFNWLANVAGSLLNVQVAPGFTIGSLFYVVLVVGVLLWFIKLIS